MALVLARLRRVKLLAVAAWTVSLLLATGLVVEGLGWGWAQPWALWGVLPRVRAAQTADAPLKIVAIGSSHIYHGIVPRTAEQELRRAGVNAEVYNVASNGGGITQSLVLIRDALLPRDPNAILLVGISGYDFRGDEADRLFRYHLAGPRDVVWLAQPPLLPGALEISARACLRGPRVVLELPLLRAPQLGTEARALDVTHGGVWLPPETAAGVKWNRHQLQAIGWRADANMEQAVPELRAAGALDPSTGAFRRACAALRQVLLIARERRARVVILSDPMARERLAVPQAGANYQLVLEHVRHLCAQYRVPLYDVNRPQPRFALSAFFDRAHLGPEGAVRYTQMVVREAVLPLLPNSAQRPPHPQAGSHDAPGERGGEPPPCGGLRPPGEVTRTTGDVSVAEAPTMADAWT